MENTLPPTSPEQIPTQIPKDSPSSRRFIITTLCCVLLVSIVGTSLLIALSRMFYPPTGLNDQETVKGLRQMRNNISPTPSDPTANWKTYIDKDNQYSFSYPPSSKIEESQLKMPVKNPSTSQDIQTVIKTVGTSIDNVTSEGRGFRLNIDTIPYSKTLTLDQFVNETCEKVGAENNSINGVKSDNIILSGKTAMMYKDNNCGLSGNTSIYVVNGDKGYKITIGYTTGVNSYTDFEFVVNKILSTFKFTQ